MVNVLWVALKWVHVGPTDFEVAAMKTYGLGLEFLSPAMRGNEKARARSVGDPWAVELVPGRPSADGVISCRSMS